MCRLLKEHFDSHDFEQLISQPTRTTPTSSSCIDLIFTNFPLLFKHVKVLPPLINCDHNPIVAVLETEFIKHTTYTRHVWDYKRGDYVKFRALLSNTRWDSVFAKTSMDDKCTEFTEMLMLIASECIPNYMCTIRPRDKPWITNSVKQAMRTRNRLFKRLKGNNNNEVLRAQYKHARNSVVSEIRSAKREYENNILHTLSLGNSGGKDWWKCLRQLQGKSMDAPIPPLIVNNNLISDEREKANVLNDFFVSHSTIDRNLEWDPGEPPPLETHIDSIHLTPHEIYKILSNLDSNKATGPDKIGYKLLREAAPSISNILCRLFNESLELSMFPDSWKRANVIPLHKKNDRRDPNN